MNSKKFPYVLYVATSSATRHELLRQAGIDFKLIHQHADESTLMFQNSLEQFVIDIAILKMNSVDLTSIEAHEGQVIYVLTADTLSQDVYGNVLGKPKNRDEAIEQIRLASHGSTVSTGFCLDKKKLIHGAWITEKRIVQAVSSTCKVVIPTSYINYYLDNSYAMQSCGSIIIEGIGMQFVQEICGSYSSILGLPMFELRNALDSLIEM